MKKLKIAFITNNYKPYSGGVVSSIESFSQELIRLGHQVYIITLDFKNTKETDHEYVIRLKCPIKFLHKNRPVSIPITPAKSILSLLKELKIDIAHSHHPFLLGKSALKAAKKLKIPIIFTNHTQYKEYAHNIPMPTTITKPLAEHIALKYCQSVDHIIAPSNSTLKYLQSHNIETNISVVPSGINRLFFHQKEQYNIDKIRLLSVSRFTKEKNIPFLIELFAKLDQNKFSLTLVGYGPELDNLKDLTGKLKVSPNIEFIVAPTKELLSKTYRTSDIFIFASRSETQGIVLAEAMASSVPVVSLTGPGQDDIVVNGINGYLVDHESDMLETLNYLETNRDVLQNLGLNAYKTSLNFDPTSLTIKLVEIYRNLKDSYL